MDPRTYGEHVHGAIPDPWEQLTAAAGWCAPRTKTDMGGDYAWALTVENQDFADMWLDIFDPQPRRHQ